MNHALRPRYRLTLAAAALTCVTGAALGQDAVKIYGNFDVAVNKETGNPIKLDRGDNNRLGFKGSEDLGDGLSATFKLETRFRADTGTVERGAVFWQGESTVGLSSKTWGTVRLGRALSPFWQDNWAYEPWEATGFNASLGAFQDGNYSFSSDGTTDAALGFAGFARVPNSVFYNSPSLGGVTVAVSAQVEHDPTAKTRNRGVSVTYGGGSLALTLSAETNTNADKLAFLAGSYELGALKLMGSVTRITPDTARSETSYVVGGTYTIGLGKVRAGYGRDRETDVSKLSLGYVYWLSKRTSVYADAYRQREANSFNGTALGITHFF